MYSNSAHALADIHRYILLECTRLRARRRRTGSSISTYNARVYLDYLRAQEERFHITKRITSVRRLLVYDITRA